MSTASWNAIDDLVGAQFLTFAPRGGGSTLDALLTGGLWVTQGPDDLGQTVAGYPYGVLRRAPGPGSGGDDGDLRQVVNYELQIYARPRTALAACESAADVADEAMLKWVYSDADGGLIYSTTRRRDTMPPFPVPADRELCCVRLLYELHVWPALLEQYDTPGL